MRRRLAQVCSAVLAFLFLSPGYACAQWASWYGFGTEGSYVHQTAHFLFFAAMLFFIHEIYHADLQKFRGFRLLIWTWAFLALWNADAIVGHWADWTLYNPVILGEGVGRRLLMDSVKTWLFYIGKIDHFVLLLPAFYLFYRGMKALDRQAGSEEP